MPGAQQVIAGKAYVLIEAIDKASKELKKVADEMNKTKNRSMVLGKINAALKKISMSAKEAAAKIQMMGRKLQGIGSSLQGAGLRAGLAGISGLIPVRHSLQSAREYSDVILSLAGVLRSTRKDIKPLEDDIRNLGKTTSFTAVQIAEGAEILARSGMDLQQVRGALRDTMNLARAGKVDVSVAATTMARAIKAFGLDATEATRVSDGLFEASRLGVTTVEELASALSFSAGSAATLGVSLEETLGVLTTISNAMLVGTKGGTSFNNMLIRLATRGDLVAKRLGFTAFDPETGELRNMADMALLLSDALNKMSKEQQMVTLEEIFNIRGARAAAAIKLLREDVPQAIEAIKNSQGEAEKQRKIMESGIGGTIDRILSAFKDLDITIGEIFGENLAKIEQWVRDALNNISEWAAKNKWIGAVILKSIAALLAFGAAAIALGIAIKLAGIALTVLGGILSAGLFLAPIIAKVGILYAAFEFLTLLPGPVGEAFRAISNTVWKTLGYIGQVFGMAFDGIKERIMAGDIEGAMNILTVALGSVFDIAIAGMKESWLNFTFYIKQMFIDIVAAIKQVWVEMQNWISKKFLDFVARHDWMNTLFEKFSGVNLKAELERAQRLGNEENMAGNILDQELQKKKNEIDSEAVKALKKLTEETDKLREQYAKQRKEALGRVKQSVKVAGLPAPAPATAEGGVMVPVFEIPENMKGGPMGGAKAGQVAGLEFGSEAASTKAYENQQKMVDSLNNIVDNTNQIAKNTKDNQPAVGV